MKTYIQALSGTRCVWLTRWKRSCGPSKRVGKYVLKARKVPFKVKTASMDVKTAPMDNKTATIDDKTASMFGNLKINT